MPSFSKVEKLFNSIRISAKLLGVFEILLVSKPPPLYLGSSFVALYEGAPGLAMLDGAHVVLHHLLLPPVFYWLPAVAALHAKVLHLCKEIVYHDEYFCLKA